MGLWLFGIAVRVLPCTQQCFSWSAKQRGAGAQRYYQWICTYDSESSVEELSDTFNQILLEAFERFIETLRGRQVVVALSGGVDSRLVAAILKHFKYDNVLCFTYGVIGNREAQGARKAAELLGYRWMQTA